VRPMLTCEEVCAPLCQKAVGSLLHSSDMPNIDRFLNTTRLIETAEGHRVPSTLVANSRPVAQELVLNSLTRCGTQTPASCSARFLPPFRSLTIRLQ
jgi:hypothetical protein